MNIEKFLEKINRSPHDVRFSEMISFLNKIGVSLRCKGGSHHKGMLGDTLINIQEFNNGKCKPYQVNQILKALSIEGYIDEQGKLQIPD